MNSNSVPFFPLSLDAASLFGSSTASERAAFTNRLTAKQPLKWDHLFNEKVNQVFQKADLARVEKEATPETFFSKYISEGNGIITDLLSVARNSTSATTLFLGAEATAKAAAPIAGMAIAGGAMTGFSGLNGMRKAAENLSTDYQHKNLEGGFVHGTQGLQSTSLATLGGTMVVSNAASLAGAAAVASGATMGLMVSGFAMYGLFGIVTSYGLGVNLKFRYELNQKENESPLEAMVWLASQVRGGETEEELQQKWDQFAFRTSEACCRYVRQEITPELLENLKNKDAPGHAAAFVKAQDILNEVKLANGKQLLKYTIYAALTLLGLTAFIFALIYTGPIVPLLFAIGAALWFVIDSSKVHQKLGDLIIGKSEIPEAQAHPSSAKEEPKAEASSSTRSFDEMVASIFKPLRDVVSDLGPYPIKIFDEMLKAIQEFVWLDFSKHTKKTQTQS